MSKGMIGSGGGQYFTNVAPAKSSGGKNGGKLKIINGGDAKISSSGGSGKMITARAK